MRYRVICECGYHCGGLSKHTAEVYAAEHNSERDSCDALVEEES